MLKHLDVRPRARTLVKHLCVCNNYKLFTLFPDAILFHITELKSYVRHIIGAKTGCNDEALTTCDLLYGFSFSFSFFLNLEQC